MGNGAPAEAADQMLGIFAAGRAGEFAAGDPTLVTLLGREPIASDAVLCEICPASEPWTAPECRHPITGVCRVRISIGGCGAG
ncbi:hypothetical protein [Streptomyces antibioticus]|uniref:hypothetical protein n=1 Tax=Streptomyces antibioticus TaxID=1890 RepID=UPI00340E6FA9